MEAPTKLALALLLLIPQALFAASPDVMVVVNGNSEVNRESYNFIRKTFQFNNLTFNVTATLKPETVKAGRYKTVVVLNTGVTSGIDPVLARFIDGYDDKKGLFLVNLFRGKSDLTVTTFTAATSPQGVDGVTAASTWRSTFGGPDPLPMHEQWVRDLVKFLQRP